MQGLTYFLFMHQVSVEKFPYKSGFEVDQTQFVVDADSEVILSVTWAPVEVGSVRETVYLRADQACRLQFIIVAVAEKRHTKRTRKVRHNEVILHISRSNSPRVISKSEYIFSLSTVFLCVVWWRVSVSDITFN